MKKLGSQGITGKVIIYIVLLAASLISLVAYLISGQDDTVKIGSDKDSALAEVVDDKIVDPPENWQTYTNDLNDYTFNYPASWGTVIRESPSTDTYKYTFTTRDRIVITQAPDSQSGIDFAGDNTIFNRFKVDGSSIELCSNSDCDKSLELDSEQARVDSNLNMNDLLEVFVRRSETLELVSIIKTDYNSYPGLNVVVIADDAVDPESETIGQQAYDAEEENFKFFGEIRDFQKYVR